MSSQPAAANTPPVVQPSSGNAIVINSCQRLNPLLNSIRNVSKEFGDIIPDFQVGRTTCVLYLSLKYHRLHPEYIHQRIEKLGHMYNLRILLIMCDISEHQDSIRELTKTCLINNITVMVAWSIDEAALYLSTFKSYEHKPPDLIKERVDKDYRSVLRSALTSVKGINKTDVETLRSNCGSFAGVAQASEQTLLNLPGLAQTKVRRLKDAFQKPFWNAATSRLPPPRSTQPALTFIASTPRSEAPTDGEGPVSNLGVTTGSKRPREPSPLPATSGTPVPRLPRSPSPVWDIELDLNDSPPTPSKTLDFDHASKKRKADHPFGEPTSLNAPSPITGVQSTSRRQ